MQLAKRKYFQKSKKVSEMLVMYTKIFSMYNSINKIALQKMD